MSMSIFCLLFLIFFFSLFCRGFLGVLGDGGAESGDETETELRERFTTTSIKRVCVREIEKE